MKTQNRVTRYSRRDFGKLAMASLPAMSLLVNTQGRPNSVWGGVPIGSITPYSFRGEATTAEEILKALIKVGLSVAEIGNEPVEIFAGAPMPATQPAAQPAAQGNAAGGAATEGRAGGGRGGGRAALTPEQQAAQQAAAAARASWRTTVSMDKFAALRKLYNDAGVTLAAYRFTLTATMTDAEYDYTFRAAKALGASQVTMELPASPEVSQRIGTFAARHQLRVGYHLHTTATLTAWDQAIAQSPMNGIQLDIGHYVAGTSESPIPFIQKHHARIASLHLKDRKRGNNGNVNMPWGQGDTPIAEVLQLMKKERWTFPAFIELEYPTPEGSTKTDEVAKCVAYCKAALG
jgi:sugar phosphate isomerase/epimerase